MNDQRIRDAVAMLAEWAAMVVDGKFQTPRATKPRKKTSRRRVGKEAA